MSQKVCSPARVNLLMSLCIEQLNRVAQTVTLSGSGPLLLGLCVYSIGAFLSLFNCSSTILYWYSLNLDIIQNPILSNFFPGNLAFVMTEVDTFVGSVCTML